ncbi:hypothetical protein N7468_008009 [Penicillium chermesinum]|uniref:RNA 3'-terminal phosphate cyclase domain-containing protein n=1 Tax=Penicillium chermesinum TaxID=63820 RepID=A0A9W9NP00_9EURO|nr:uncharacterized protein N7468_008009 [Penicillium chermesinum]KAJ5223467.1 hypothetical protein N7468_008009 [Penicillium chermesinum]KAJ6155701.1 hypothetical protein N7470_006267 [Penicillium chermesinum]
MADPTKDSRPDPQPRQHPRPIELDGCTLQGGGQLVRIAMALAALTGRPITIKNIRAGRPRGGGIKPALAAGIDLLASISGSTVVSGHVGATNMTFQPPPPPASISPTEGSLEIVSLSNLQVDPEYHVCLSTPGSTLLVFQILYPYLMHVATQSPTGYVNLRVTGSTNAVAAPSYDYAAQVMVPNFARLGLPKLSITLHKRGWASPPIEMGEMGFSIHPVSSLGRGNQTSSKTNPFPSIHIMDHERGKVTQIDITVLAPDVILPGLRMTVRKYIEDDMKRACQVLETENPSLFEPAADPDNPASPRRESVQIHTSETTQNNRIYLLLVAHTSTGFRLGFDAQLERRQIDKGKIIDIMASCVEGFLHEISDDPKLEDQLDADLGPVRRSCLDSYMRDQIVIFEALGKIGQAGPPDSRKREDTRYLSSHTKTAQWVCKEILGTSET